MTTPSNNDMQALAELHKLWDAADEQPDKVIERLNTIKDNDPSIVIKAQCQVIEAFLNFRKNEITQTAKLIYQAKAVISGKRDLWEVRMLRVLALLYYALGNKEQQFRYHTENLELALEVNDLPELSTSYLNLAYYFISLAKFDQAYKHIKKAEPYIDSNKTEVVFHANLGWLYCKQEAFTKSETEYLKALECSQRYEIHRYTILIFYRLSELELSRKHFTQGIKYCLQALELAEEKKESTVLLELMLSELYVELEQYDKAESFARTALKHCEQEKLDALPSAYQLLSRINKQKRRYKKALEYQELYSIHKDKQASDQSKMKQQALEVIYQTEVLKGEKKLIEEKNAQLKSYIQELEILNEKVKELSIRDALTGLYNRRYLFEQAENILKLSRRYGRSLTVVMLDIDHFKGINDRFFHSTGDLVLKIIAQLLQAGLRDADPISRYGGEEFAILLPETALEGAVLACERLRKSIESYDWSSIDADLKVTVSIGLASDMSCETVEALFSLADARLYEAKRSGRNRLAYASEVEVMNAS